MRLCWTSKSGFKKKFIIYGCLSLCAVTAGARFLRSSSDPLPSLISLEENSMPPEVPHDGIRVVQPFDPNHRASCAKQKHSPKDPSLVEKQRTFGTSLLELESTFNGPNFLADSTITSKAAEKARRHREAFACTAGCSSREPQLELSLSPWAEWSKNTSGLHMLDALEGFCASERDSHNPFLITVLWKGDVYLKACRANGVDEVSLYLIGPEDLSLVLIFLFGAQRIAHLPSGPITFGMYLSDYSSLLDRHLVGPGIPIFSYLGRDTSWLIPWPSSFSVMATQDTEDWQNEQKTTKSQLPWEKREKKAYWVGTITGPWEFAVDDALTSIPRLKLLKLAKQHPDQLHVEWSGTAVYGISWVKDDNNVSGFLAPRSQSVEELTGISKSKYRSVASTDNFQYYINLDGVVMGGRLNKLLSLGGVVLQHQAGYKEHFDALLKPYEHYVPIEYDLSDLVSKIKWLQSNPAIAKRIAENGQRLALSRMRFEDHACYIWRAVEALGVKTASSEVDDKEVEERLKLYKRAEPYDSGLVDTMEAFWGQKLEDIKTGDRALSARGIELLEWAWHRMKGIYDKVVDSER